MEDTAVKLTPKNSGSEQPHDDKVRSRYEQASSNFEIEFSPMDSTPSNVYVGGSGSGSGNGDIVAHPTIGVTNATPQEIFDFASKYGTSGSLNKEQKQFRRMLSNRLSAQRSRVKKAEHLVDLEQNRKDLEIMVSTLYSRIEHEKQKILRIRVENAILVQKLDICAETAIRSNAQIEKTRGEIEKLKELLMINANSHEFNQQEELMTGWGFDNSGLDEITTESFYLQSGPQSLLGANLDQNEDIDMMLSLSPRDTRLDQDGLDPMQNSNPSTTA